MKTILCHPKDHFRIARFVSKLVGGSANFGDCAAIGIERNGEIIAGVIYNNWNGVNVHATIAGKDRTWLTREFLGFMFRYPFLQTGVERVTCCVEEANIDSQRLAERLGFKLEAVLEKAGRTGDLLIYRLFKHECRYLEDADKWVKDQIPRRRPTTQGQLKQQQQVTSMLPE